jgi:hypothetical protein
LDEELKKYGFSLESPRKLVSLLLKINQIGYDALKIVSFVARIKSLKQTERILKNNCTTLEARTTRYREVLPMCVQIMRLGIGFSEMVAFHTAVIKRADSGNIPKESAAYRVMEEIENYERIGGLKNEISKLVMQKFTIDQICEQRNKAITSLIKLQSYGVADEEIFDIHEFLNRVRLDSAIGIGTHNHFDLYPFNCGNGSNFGTPK